MAELVYDETGRLLFTKEMKEEYTLLMPQMLPVHFGMLRQCLELEGYHVDMLTTSHRGIVDTGLKYVHNDTCYPALLVIGQLIDALQSGKYDTHKVGLLITQTGGGCRASNYIHLLRKALVKAGLEYVPVVSVNLSGLEHNPGFSLNLRMLRRIVNAIYYGDLLTCLANQCRPYEVQQGQTDALLQSWQNQLIEQFRQGGGLSKKEFLKNMDEIAASFAALPVEGPRKIAVGIVGEIYVKFSSLGNNNLEKFLLDEGVEPVVPGLADFLIFKINNRDVDVDLYGGKKAKQAVVRTLQKYFEDRQAEMIEVIKRYPQFRVPAPFSHLQELIKGYVGYGNKMGEGWLLTAEMLDLIHAGVTNIICTQPFGCLPNHVAGKGMVRKLKDDYPDSNIVAIDYDAGATKINQENRIKLMLANAARNQKKAEETAKTPAAPAAVQA